jgi:peptidoglycan/LPS O-acetylase OafA/YrhL
MGKYTYGMYLYHAIFIILVKIFLDKIGIDYHTNLLVILGMAIVSLSLTILTSILSYNYFEKPFLKLKGKFASVKTRM